MSELRYDERPIWQYDFPVPAVNLAVTPTAVGPPTQVRCVGVDGRRRGSLRRFPGFRLIRDLTSDIGGLANVERFWYVSIQKGATPYVLRGFAILADSITDNTFKALFLAVYDTQDAVWRNYTLEDFAVNDRITGVRVQNYFPNELTIRPPSPGAYNATATATYFPDRGTAFAIMEDDSGTAKLFVYDVTSGRIVRVLPDTTVVAHGMTQHTVNGSLYATISHSTAANNKLHTVDPDTGQATLIGAYSPSDQITDLAYQKTGSILWGVKFDTGGSGTISQISVADASRSGTITLSVDNIVAIEFDNTANVLYGMTSGKDFSSGSAVDVKLYTINTTTGVCTEVFNFETNGFGESGREPMGRPEDGLKGSIIIPPNSGMIYIMAGNTWLALELDQSSGPRTYDSVDVSSTWRYIYAVFEAQDVRRQLNRAYFWNPDTSTVEGRHAGWLAPAALESSGVTAVDNDGVIGDSKRVTAAVRLVSRRHALASPLSTLQQVTTAAAAGADHHIKLEINKLNLPTDLSLNDLDIEVYRTIGADKDLTVDDVPLMGLLYPDTLKSFLTLGNTATAYGGRSAAAYDNAKSDRELTARLSYNFTLQHVGLWPRTALVRATDDQVFLVAKPFLGDDPATRFVELSEKASWRVMWSPPEKYELENFRGAVTGEQYRFPDAQATIFALERVGDFVFACTDLGVIRFHKSGSYVAVNPLGFKWGIQGRDAVTTMGNQLVLATSIGLMQVDGPTMQEQGISVVQRLLSSTEFWREDLASINLAYDSQLGALMLFNPVKDEMYLLWPDTGGVTSLEDCPWIQAAEGVDPVLGGSPRSFWITSDGRIHTPDAEETADKKTMYGAATADTVNGTATGGTTTTLVDTGAAFGSGAKSFRVHFLSGSNAGSSRTISAVTGTQLTWTSALSIAIASGDRYAVAPIPFRVRGHQILGPRGIDMFRRKIVTGMSANIDLLGGEDTGSNPNLKMDYKVYRHVATAAPSMVTVTLAENVTLMAGPINVQDTIMFPEWVCMASNLDFQMLSGRVSGRMTSSRATSDPVSVS